MPTIPLNVNFEGLQAKYFACSNELYRQTAFSVLVIVACLLPILLFNDIDVYIQFLTKILKL